MMAEFLKLGIMRHALFVATVAGFGLLPLYSQTNGAAKVVAVNGQVSLMRDNTPWVLNAGSIVQPKQLIVTGPDGYAEFEVLSDGSRFEVFPNSRTVFRANPGSWKDLLDVVIGRVKVHIQKFAGQPNRNSVRTQTAVISVRGTVFDVVVEDADDTTLVSVDEGEVRVEHLWKPGEKILVAGEWVRVYKNQPLSARTIDRSGFAVRALRAAADALYEAIYRSGRGSPSAGGGSSPSAGGQGDQDKGAPPPAPPPGPPPGPPPE